MVEQDCAYLDIDGRDLQAWHLLGTADNGMVEQSVSASSRVMISDDKKYAVIGRIVVSQELRGQGFGSQIVQESILFIQNNLPNMPVKISAQLQLLDFYASLGFIAKGNPYDEDGIMHIDMFMRR